jgi:NADH-quinone oxidoreductase subunit N
MEELLYGLALLGPEIALVITALLILTIDLSLDATLSRQGIQYLAILGLAIAAGAAALMGTWDLAPFGGSLTALGGALVVDKFAVFFKLLFIMAAGLVMLTAESFLGRGRPYQAEFYATILFATIGLMLMASTTELISIYLSLELSALSLTFLAGWAKRDRKSVEAGMKFFMLSAMSSAILLYGMALLYGVTGSTSLATIASVLTTGATPAALLAMAMVLAGFGFKIAAVPFQMWTPDVYEGAPTPSTAFFSTASKAAGFAVLLRVFQTAFPEIEPEWATLLAVLALLTMTLGNLAALVQTNIKRMLAYSSIAHVGYMLVGFAAVGYADANQLGFSSVMFYLLVYAFTNIAAFAVVSIVGRSTGDDYVSSYAGLSRRAPMLSFVLAAALLSLAGLPPLAGFFSKLYLFWAAAEAGLYWLVVAGVINSAISLFYYARVIRQMYLVPAEQEQPMGYGFGPALSLGATLLAIFVIGPISAPFIAAAVDAAQAITR